MQRLARAVERLAAALATRVVAWHVIFATIVIAASPASAQTAPLKPFALRLVEAARAQVSPNVVYSSGYVKLKYPMGDIPLDQGVCTDVIVRAYRALGHDLQSEIYETGRGARKGPRLGTGDRNIDHRRVTVQRAYFARFGISIPLKPDPRSKPDTFQPGDIVSYQLPPGSVSPTHIAIVSDRKTAQGIPLVIHNRGSGVQEEDWLFGWKLTGHYRFEPSAR